MKLQGFAKKMQVTYPKRPKTRHNNDDLGTTKVDSLLSKTVEK